ncbi:MAG: hypothetical protein OHK0015_31860 [Chloroflexi bacterium OHK40]
MATQRVSEGHAARRTFALLAGDLVVFMAFAALGRRSHGAAAGLGALGEVALTAAPFMLGWLVAAPVLGALDSRATRGPLAMLGRALVAWVLALAIGSVVRALIIGRFSPPSFYLVTFLVVAVLIGGWRAAFAWWAARRG